VTFFSPLIIGESVDRFHFEWQSIDLIKRNSSLKRLKQRVFTYQNNLLDYVNTVDRTIAILIEAAVCHHGLLRSLILVVDRDNQWIVVFDRFCQLKGCHVVEVKDDLAILNLLINSSTDSQVLNIVISVRRVEHLWSIVRIFLLCDASVHADVGIA